MLNCISSSMRDCDVVYQSRPPFGALATPQLQVMGDAHDNEKTTSASVMVDMW